MFRLSQQALEAGRPFLVAISERTKRIAGRLREIACSGGEAASLLTVSQAVWQHA